MSSANKILYIGNYRDGTGYGHLAIDLILALDAVGVDVVCRPIKLNHTNLDIPPRLIELEKKSVSDCDIVIQHTLPCYMEYIGGKKNIGIFSWETTNFKNKMWAEFLNTQDEIWTFGEHSRQACLNSYVTKPVKTIPPVTDITKFDNHYLPLDIPNIAGTFVFYTIIDTNNRKNVQALVRAFHTEFDPEEPVNLLIKAAQHDGNQANVLKGLQDLCNNIKENIHLRNHISSYKPEILVTNMVDDNTIYRLHTSCDCLVFPSCGESPGLVVLDGLGFGKTPIVTNWSGMTDIVNESVGWPVAYNMQQVIGNAASIYSSQEDWAVIDINKLRKAMREAYSNEELRSQKIQASKLKIKEFSYKAVGSKLLELLNA